MNQATSLIDSFQLYGHKLAKANSIRMIIGGKLITDIIDENEFRPLRKRNGSLLCDGCDNVGICFEAGNRIRAFSCCNNYNFYFIQVSK